MRHAGVRVQTQDSRCEKEDTDSWEHVEFLPAYCWCCEHLGSFLMQEGCMPALREPGGGERWSLRLAVVLIHTPEDTVEVVLQLNRAMSQLSVSRPPSP